MTDCTETRQNLHLYLGGELEPSQASTAKRHLAGCAPCRAALEDALQARELYLSAAVDADAEELDLWPGIRSRLVSEGRLEAAPNANTPAVSNASARVATGAGARTVQVSSPRLGKNVVWAGLAAAAAALLLFALPFLRAQPPSSPASPIATPERPQPVFVPEPVSTDALAGSGIRLHPVLQGDESLIERAWRQRLQGEQGGVGTLLPQDQGANEVVNERWLR